MADELRTKTGKILTNEKIEALADEAEQGYDPARFRQREIRPPEPEAHVTAECHNCDWTLKRDATLATLIEVQEAVAEALLTHSREQHRGG